MVSRRVIVGSVVALGLLVAAGVAYVAWRGTTGGPAALSSESARKLIHTKNVGLGYLENQKVPEGIAAFEEIRAALPDEPLAARNLAVARVLDLGAEFEPASPEKITAARESLAAAAKLEGADNAALEWLGLRLAVAERDLDAANKRLDAILARDADDASAWYARYRIDRLAEMDQTSDQALAALDKALALNGANAWLLVEWLRAKGTQLSRQQEEIDAETIARQLEQSRSTAQAFAYVIQAHARIDVLKQLDDAVAALRQGNRAVAGRQMIILANILLPHASPDQQPLNRHPLEFVLDEFQPEFYEAAKLSEVEQAPAIEVALVVNDSWQPSEAMSMALAGARDVALSDFDLDGRLDVIALTEKQLAVWFRSDQGEWTELATAEAVGYERLIVQDLDNDFDETSAAVHGSGTPAEQAIGSPALRNGCPSADVDVVVYGQSGVALFENRFAEDSRVRSLVLHDDAAKRPALAEPVLAMACADWEADGDLDLALATAAGLQIWSNNGEWGFADLSSRSSLPEGLADAAQLVPFDWDRDVDIDCLVAAPSGGGWLENLRHGQLRWRPFDKELAPLAKATALAPIDPRGRASWHVLAATSGGIEHLATTTPASGVLRPGESKVAVDQPVRELLMWDYDNDGVQDILAWSADSTTVHRGLTNGTFAKAEILPELSAAVERAAAGDLDNDGDLDLLLLADGEVQLAENQGGNAHHWIDVALQAQQIKGQQHSPSGRVSPYGVGSLLELKAGSRYQAAVVSGQTTHFGLGEAKEADVVRVSWLNGVPQNIIRPAADLFVCEQQILNTSCPYLYAWNGERFEFVTDLLWNAPLGLQLAEGQLAPSRNWEYLKIPGEAVAPRDDRYVLQVTAELWEADYFDEVQLIAVDHPADVAIYSNEKVGPAEIAEFKIHTVKRPRPLVRATSSDGRDLSADLAKADGVYARPFARKLRQGVTEDHFLELDLGNLGEARNITLFLTGWVFPASTSINVALSQGGSLLPPRPPALEVPDGEGGWREALPFMGFPGGKTKTIAIDLSGKLAPGDGRLRIRTSMELYWDHAFLTMDATPAEVRTTKLELTSANLHERGYSRVTPDPANGPERFAYDQVSTMPKWPAMHGRFTRLGDVRVLLEASDDRLLVMGAGDETTLEFAVPNEPVPAGWKRDFLLYSVGWDKDANLETILGATVEPLPFGTMSAYPWPPSEHVPISSDYDAYQEKWQTRPQTGAYWRAILRSPEKMNSVP